MEGSCGQKSGAARECCCSCEGGSRRQVLEGGGGLTAGAEITKTGQGNAAVQDGITARGAGHDSNIQLTKRTNKKCKNLELRLQFCHFCYNGGKKKVALVIYLIRTLFPLAGAGAVLNSWARGRVQ